MRAKTPTGSALATSDAAAAARGVSPKKRARSIAEGASGLGGGGSNMVAIGGGLNLGTCPGCGGALAVSGGSCLAGLVSVLLGGGGPNSGSAFGLKKRGSRLGFDGFWGKAGGAIVGGGAVGFVTFGLSISCGCRSPQTPTPVRMVGGAMGGRGLASVSCTPLASGLNVVPPIVLFSSLTEVSCPEETRRIG